MYGRGSVYGTGRSALRVGGVLFALLLCPSIVSAQAWLSDRRNTQGPGLMFSDSWVFHAGIGIEGGYDTNVFYNSANEVGAGRLRLSPQIELSTLPPQRTENADGTTTESDPTIDFRFGLAGIYHQYLVGGDDPNYDAVMDQSDFGIQNTLFLTVFPKREWSFVLDNTFTRTIDPQNDVGPSNLNRDYDAFHLGVRWAPGGGSLEMHLLAGLMFNLYEEGGDVAQVGDYVSPGFTLDGRWRFLPNTALTFETTFYPVLKVSTDSGLSPDGDYPVSNSFPIRAWVGLNGQWTTWLSTSFRVGYGAGIYDKGDDFDSALAQAEFDFILGPFGHVKVGFIRDFVDSFFSNFYTRNQAYLRWDHLFSGAFLVGAQFQYSYNEFATLYSCPAGVCAEATADVNNVDRVDHRIGGSLFLEYRIKDWVGINASVTYEQNITDFVWNVASASTSRDESYWKLTAFGGVRFMY